MALAPAMNAPARSVIEQTLLEFCDAFNRNDLDAVMRHFTEDAVYHTFDDVRHVGKQAIRAAFEPQFRGKWGVMRFHDEDLIVDEPQQRAVLRWVCEHDVRGGPLLGRLLSPLFGDRPRWQGLDVFYLDGALIREKHTFARTRWPLLHRTLAPEPWRGAAPIRT